MTISKNYILEGFDFHCTIELDLWNKQANLKAVLREDIRIFTELDREWKGLSQMVQDNESDLIADYEFNSMIDRADAINDERKYDNF